MALTPQHHFWDALAADPAARAALSIDEVLALLRWNDPNGTWADIIDVRAGTLSDPDGEFSISDDEIRSYLEEMMKNG